MGIAAEVAKIVSVDLFERDGKTGELSTGTFVGRPFHLDFSTALVLVADAWKQKAGGVPQGCFLLAYYENEEKVSEAVLLRVLSPTKLPTDCGSHQFHGGVLQGQSKNSRKGQPTRLVYADMSSAFLACSVASSGHFTAKMSCSPLVLTSRTSTPRITYVVVKPNINISWSASLTSEKETSRVILLTFELGPYDTAQPRVSRKPKLTSLCM